MSLNGVDDIIYALAQDSALLPFNKAGLANMTGGSYASLWRSAGQPGPGAIPTVAAPCDRTLGGAIPFSNPASPKLGYLLRLYSQVTVVNTNMQIHDRISHMGGLVANVTTPQIVNVDASISTNNIPNRRGSVDYSELMWFTEFYQDAGAAAANLTYVATYDDNSTGNIVLSSALGTASRIGRMIQIVPAVAGRYIKSLSTVACSTNTGTAGNFGVTVTRYVSDIFSIVAGCGYIENWADVACARIHDDACLQIVVINGTATTGIVSGGATVGFK